MWMMAQLDKEEDSERRVQEATETVGQHTIRQRQKLAARLERRLQVFAGEVDHWQQTTAAEWNSGRLQLGGP